MKHLTRAFYALALIALGVFAGGRDMTAAPSLARAPHPAAVTPVTATLAPDSLFHPVQPCRIVDTRAGSPISSGATKTYVVGGKTGFSAQGGATNGCGVPVGATAISATFSAVAASNDGYLRAWPADKNEPGATLLNYLDGKSTGTGTTVSIANAAAGLKVKNYGGPTDLVIDVNGYYTLQLTARIDGSGLAAGTGHVTALDHFATGQWAVTFDRYVQSCSILASPYYDNEYAAASFTEDPASILVSLWYLDPTSHAQVHVNDVVFVTISC